MSRLLVVIVVSAVMSWMPSCRPPPVEWPAFERVEVSPDRPGVRRLVLPSSYEAFLLGQIAFDEGDFSAASRSFEDALRTDPFSAYLQTWVAKAELSRGRLQEARRAIDRALEEDGCSEFALCTAASILVEEGDEEGAMRSLQRAIECEPRQPEAYYQLAALLEQQGAAGRAEAIYLSLLEVLPRQGLAYNELARIALERGDGEDAAEWLSALLELEPWRSGTVLQLAELTLAQGDTTSARALLEAVVARNPRDGEARLFLVRILLAAGNTAGAARHLEQLRSEDDDIVALAELASLNLRARRYEVAEQDASRLLSLDALHPVGRRVLVAALRHQGRLDAVLTQARAVSARVDGSDHVRCEAALSLWEAGQLDEARALLEQQLSAEPASPRSRELLARLLDRQGHRAQAEALLRVETETLIQDRLALATMLLEWGRAADVEAALAPILDDNLENVPPSVAQASAVRARALLRLGQRQDQALELARQAQRLEPLDAEHLALVGALEAAGGRSQEGIAMLESARRMSPGSAEILTALARAYHDAHRCADAMSMVELAARFQPSDDCTARLDELRRDLGSGCQESTDGP